MDNDSYLEEEIRAGKRVFKITSVLPNGTTKEIDMVNTFEDYEKKVKTHLYTPLLFKLNFKDRIGYLYGCFNNHFGVARTEIFTIYTRLINTSEWKEWYTFMPQVDII